MSMRRYLYMHGFASGPLSKKGVAMERHLAGRGLALSRLDVRVPSLERLRLSAIIDTARRAIGALDDRAVVFGSSLGGLAAAHLAARDTRVEAVVLLAPGFRVAANFRRRLGEEAMRRWQEEGWLETHDYATGTTSRVDWGFLADALAVDGQAHEDRAAERAEFPDVRAPCLVIHGRGDETCPVEVSRQFAEGRPNVRLVEVDDGHELLESLPVIFAETDRFLAEHGLG